MKKNMLLLFMIIFSTTVSAQEWVSDCKECYIEKALKSYGTCRCGETIHFAKKNAFKYDEYGNPIVIKYKCEVCGHDHVFRKVNVSSKRRTTDASFEVKRESQPSKRNSDSKKVKNELNSESDSIKRISSHKCSLEKCVKVKQTPDTIKKKRLVVITNTCPLKVSSYYSCKEKGSEQEQRSKNLIPWGKTATFVISIDKVAEIGITPVKSIGMSKEEYYNLLNESRKSSKQRKPIIVPKKNQLPKQNYNYRKVK